MFVSRDVNILLGALSSLFTCKFLDSKWMIAINMLRQFVVLFRCHLFYLSHLPFLGDNLKFKRIILVWLLARILGLKFFFFIVQYST